MKPPYQLDEGLIVAAERFAGSRVHHVNTLLSAYRLGRYPVCRTQEHADLMALRLRRILRGVDVDEAYKLWKKEFDKLPPY